MAVVEVPPSTIVKLCEVAMKNVIAGVAKKQQVVGDVSALWGLRG